MINVTRNRGTRRDGGSFDIGTRAALWNQCRTIAGEDSRAVRLDACGAPIHWAEYANTNSRYGWEVDHIQAVAVGGSDAIGNLQALQWQNNRSKGDGPATAAYCVVY